MPRPGVSIDKSVLADFEKGLKFLSLSLMQSLHGTTNKY